MRNTFKVGKGFGKYRLDDALKSANSGDVIKVEPGEYFLEEGHYGITKNLTIEGTSNNVKDVKIYGKFWIDGNFSLSLNSLTLLVKKTNNGINVKNGGRLFLNRLLIESIGEPNESDFPVVWIESSALVMKGTTIHSGDDITSIYVKENSSVQIVGSQLDSMDCFSSKNIVVDNTQICKRLQVREESELNSKTLVDLPSTRSGHYSIVVGESSICCFNQLNINTNNAEVLLTDSYLKVEEISFEDMAIMLVNYNDQSSAVFNSGGTTSNVILTNRDDVRRQEEKEKLEQEELVEEETEEIKVLNNEMEVEEIESDTEEEAQKEEFEVEEKVEENLETPEIVNYETETTPLEKLNKMYGLETVKEQIQTFVNVVKFNKSRAEKGLKSTPLILHSVFLGNPGTGKTTVARLLGEILFSEGVIRTDKFVEVTRNDLVSQYIGGTAKDTMAILEQARGGILFIDEAYSLYSESGKDTGTEAIDTILKFMEDNRDDIMIIFAGYDKEMHDFMQMNPGLESRIPNKFNFEDYSPIEIAEIGYISLLSDDYLVDEKRYKEVARNQYMRSVDYSNARWVRNLNQELQFIMMNRVVASGSGDTQTITLEDLDELAGGSQDSKDEIFRETLAELNSLTGLDEVKDYVNRLISQAKVDKLLEAQGDLPSSSTYHMTFTGNPGTGKTTIANLLAKLFFSLDILPTDNVNVVDRSDLVGAYIGHTEKNTKKVLDRSMGGVLFIDEAYQLNSSPESNDFGKQAVETLVTYLENYRDKFIVILAGYTGEMKSFMDINPGLRSRIPLTIEFPDYSPEDVANIAINILKKNWEFDEAYLKMKVIKTYDGEILQDKSNGRWGRNFSEKLIQNHKVWLSQKLDETGKLPNSKLIENEQIDRTCQSYK